MMFVLSLTPQESLPELTVKREDVRDLQGYNDENKGHSAGGESHTYLNAEGISSRCFFIGAGYLCVGAGPGGDTGRQSEWNQNWCFSFLNVQVCLYRVNQQLETDSRCSWTSFTVPGFLVLERPVLLFLKPPDLQMFTLWWNNKVLKTKWLIFSFNLSMI